jgi:hypothetical protein
MRRRSVYCTGHFAGAQLKIPGYTPTLGRLSLSSIGYAGNTSPASTDKYGLGIAGLIGYYPFHGCLKFTTKQCEQQ